MFDPVLFAALGGFLTMFFSKVADWFIDRRTNWRQESKTIHDRLRACEEHNEERERRVTALLTKIAHLEFQLQMCATEITELEKQIFTDGERARMP